MLELPIAELDERIRNEMLDNEALEESDFPDEQNSEAEDNYEDSETGDDEYETHDTTDLGIAIGDYFSEDDVPEYLKERADAAQERYVPIQAAAQSFYEDLHRQIGERTLSDDERTLLEYIVGSLDTDGFLRKDLLTLSDELAIYNNVYCDTQDLERMLAVLHTFEPKGIGARSLQECLHLQLADPDYHSPWKALSLKVVDKYFKEFASKRWDILMKRLNIDEETLGHIRHELTHLNPSPGQAFSETEGAAPPTIIPDFYVQVRPDGSTSVTLNHGDTPEIRVSRAFRDSIKEYAAHKNKLNRQQQEAYVYARKKAEEAQAFISLINRRKETLLAVMEAIVEMQRPFFNDDDENLLRPLTLKEIASIAGIDISTVSRAVSSKYVQTDYGVYSLKYFFSSQFKSESGEELSTRKVKAVLKDIIEKEDKKSPHSDEHLATLLEEAGFPVARRTVAKYREMMGIPVARLRKN